MSKSFGLRQVKKDVNKGGGQEKKDAPVKPTRRTMADIRVNKDLSEIDLPDSCKLEFPDKDDLMNFKLTISPDEGYYKKGNFTFKFTIGKNYPFDPPKVKCATPIYHPNIDEQGNVCLNILREDWKPVLGINAIVYGLQFLFLEPNPDDPLNKHAAKLFINDLSEFIREAKACVYGGYAGNKYYHGCSTEKDPDCYY